MIFGIVGCSDKVSNQQKAEEFLEKVLTTPDKDISEAVSSISLNKDSEEFESKMEEFEEKMDKAVQGLCKGYVLSKKYATPFMEVSMYQGQIAFAGDIYTVESIEVTTSDDIHFAYEATVKVHSKKESIVIKGKLQFNEDGYITYLTIPMKNTLIK